MVVSWYRERTAHKLIVIYVTNIQNGAEVDDHVANCPARPQVGKHVCFSLCVAASGLTW